MTTILIALILTCLLVLAVTVYYLGLVAGMIAEIERDKFKTTMNKKYGQIGAQVCNHNFVGAPPKCTICGAYPFRD